MVKSFVIEIFICNHVFFFLGLVTAGTGIGALSFGPLANFLMGKFGWKIGMFIFAGIMLTCILFGAIMKPLKPQKVLIKRDIELQ
jgi:MFS family permease